MRRLTKELHRIALRKGEKAAEELKEAYEKLVRVTRSSLTQAKRVGRALRGRADERSRRLADKLDHYVPLIEQGIDQAVRRVLLREEQLPAAEKVLSLFEDHTMIITRRKVAKPREYGRKVLLDEVDGGLISRYEVLSEAGREHPHLPESIEGHWERFGRAPELLTADRGLFYSKAKTKRPPKRQAYDVSPCRRVAALRRNEWSTNSRAMVQASLRVQSGRRRADQRAQEEIRPGALSLPWRRRHGPVGWLGDSGAQPGQDL